MTLDDLFAHADYARKTVDHPAVEALCDAVDEFYSRTPELGKIYFLRAGNDGPIKIGFTKGSPSDRIAPLQTGCPWPIVFLGAIFGSQVEERAMHRKFGAHWLSGEWFSPHAELLLHIMDLVNPAHADTIADLKSYRRQKEAKK